MFPKRIQSAGGEAPILVFCHIPKTAGTSMNWLLRRYFGHALVAARARPGVPDGAYRAVDLTRDLSLLPHIRCVSGHCLKPYVDFRGDEGRLAWFTFLRRPEDRFLSLYAHQQVRSAPSYRMDLLDWAQRFRRSNGMVRMLAGEENLDRAKEVLLTKFRFVGFAESFDDSLRALARACALPGFNPTLGSRRMVTKGKDLLDGIRADPARYADCIAANNALDCELYAFARAARIGWSDATATGLMGAPQSTLSMALRYGAFWLQDRTLYRPFVQKERRSLLHADTLNPRAHNPD